MAEQTPQTAGDRARVFNAETCRALRRVSRTPQAVFIMTLVLGAIALQAIGVLFSPSRLLLVWLVITYFVAVIVTGLWAAMPSREVRREVKHALVWSIARIFGRDHKLPSEYQPEVDAEDHDPNPPLRPELALGLSPEGCFCVFGGPLALLYGVLSEFGGVNPLLSIGGCIAFSGVLFVLIKHSPMANTYPPEDPPHDRE
jgi:hypothetical protein